MVAALRVPRSAQTALGFVDKRLRATSQKGRKGGGKGQAAGPTAKSLAAAVTRAASALAQTQATAAPVAAPGAGPAVWQPMGPSRIPNGQTYGSNRVDVIGRVSSVAVDPANPNHVLLGAAGGGIWESIDAGVSWAPRTDQMPSNAIGAVAFDPNDGTRVY